MATQAEMSWEQARWFLLACSEHAGEWAGIPMPIEGSRMVIEPRYPFAEILKGEPDEPDPDMELVNEWWSTAKREHVFIVKEKGKLAHYTLPKFHASAQIIKTLGACCAWDPAAELRAMEKLGALVKPHIFNQYMLTGTFLESSPRSRLTYIFRRLRPTIAASPRPNSDMMQIIACLCLHPIGFYEDSWAGALCPTDDVISHLLLMRGDEHLFWKRSNQIQPNRPEAGL